MKASCKLSKSIIRYDNVCSRSPPKVWHLRYLGDLGFRIRDLGFGVLGVKVEVQRVC